MAHTKAGLQTLKLVINQKVWQLNTGLYIRAHTHTHTCRQGASIFCICIGYNDLNSMEYFTYTIYWSPYEPKFSCHHTDLYTCSL